MRTTHQPAPDAPLTDAERVEQYGRAIQECHKALTETVDITADLADMVIDYIDGDASIDPDALKRLCEGVKELIVNTREVFSLPIPEGVDKTPSDAGIVSPDGVED